MDWSPCSDGGSSSDQRRGLGQSAGAKRSRDSADGVERKDHHLSRTPAAVGDKRGCGEEMSWWTCLMLGITPAQSRVVKRDGAQNGRESSNSKSQY